MYIDSFVYVDMHMCVCASISHNSAFGSIWAQFPPAVVHGAVWHAFLRRCIRLPWMQSLLSVMKRRLFPLDVSKWNGNWYLYIYMIYIYISYISIYNIFYIYIYVYLFSHFGWMKFDIYFSENSLQATTHQPTPRLLGTSCYFDLKSVCAKI